jgi:hypothetical protein
MSRVPTHRYSDPLDRIWLTTAARIGLRVERTGDAYASTSGDGALLLADAPHLDPDDSLAQMIFHELCHSLIQGEESFTERDWGLDNESVTDVPREHACLRLQASLAGAYGLRRLLAPTTDFRAFYDALPADPFSPRYDATTVLAILGRRRAEKPPWGPHLASALSATREIAAQTARYADAAPGVSDAGDLWALVEQSPTLHPSGLPGSSFLSDGGGCGTCAWRVSQTGKCRQADARVKPEWPACERFEPALDCQECGACCREAYDCVQVTPRDPVRKKHPELVVVRGPYLEVLRAGNRCAALGGGQVTARDGDAAALEPYACGIYEDRPKSCRDFANGGEHCLTARRKVGLSL